MVIVYLRGGYFVEVDIAIYAQIMRIWTVIEHQIDSVIYIVGR